LDQKKLNQQSQHWEKSFSNKPEMFGLEPSEAAKEAKQTFEAQKVRTFFSRKKIDILELGAGLGRDTTYLAAESKLIHVTALDYSAEAIKIINKKKKDYYSDPSGYDGKPISDRITTKVWDVRNSLPYKDNIFDGCFSHMLYCMALTTSEIIKLNNEVYRVLKPGGINIFTVRNTSDGDYKNGKHIGEDLYENDGFIVHFFSKEKIKKVSAGFKIENIYELHEGNFPRKLSVVILKKK
jgi:SAM-dependent methyltransferase